jgi:hypothetical protein
MDEVGFRTETFARCDIFRLQDTFTPLYTTFSTIQALGVGTCLGKRGECLVI